METGGLHKSLGIIFLIAMYTGLGILFYDPEQGFSWILTFLGLSVLALGVFAFLLSRAARKLLAEKERREQ